MTVSVTLFLMVCLLSAPMGVCRAELAFDGPLRVEVSTGWASQYAPGVMGRVVSRQQRLGRLPANVEKFSGFIAVQQCSGVGNYYLLRPLGAEQWELFAAADCAGPHLREDGLTGYQWMLYNNVLVEVDYETAKRWDTVGRGIKVEMVEVGG